MGKKILFLDLDGTLLNSSREISRGNRQALEEALAQGHRVVINTGRPLQSARIQNERLGFTQEGCYLSAFNGGVIYDPHGQRIVAKHSLPIETALGVIRLCDAKGVHVQTYDMERVLVEPRWDDALVKKYCDQILMEYRMLPDFDTGLREKPPKVLAVSEDNRAALKQIEQEIKENFPDVDCFFSTEWLLEIVPKGVNKGSALEHLCSLLDIPVEDSLAAGDEENDLPMIRAAGVGCAMANATQRVRDAADYITRNDNDHDGVAEIVRRFMLTD